MLRLVCFILSIIFIGILAIGFTPFDSSETTFKVMGNYGQYAKISRGCEGNVISKEKIPFNEFSVSLAHKPNSIFKLGVNGSYIFSEQQGWHQNIYKYHSYNVSIVQPYIALESKYVGLTAGYLFASDFLPRWEYGELKKSPTGHYWLGKRNGVRLDVSFLHKVPYSNGYYRLGLGGIGNQNTRLWMGISHLPYEGLGFTSELDKLLGDKFSLNTSVRLGSSEGIFEGTFGLGLTYRLHGGNRK
jgi:hypothetical protein